MPKTYIEIYRRRDGKFGYRIKSGNHRTLTPSQGYSRRWSAVRGARRVVPTAEIRG